MANKIQPGYRGRTSEHKRVGLRGSSALSASAIRCRRKFVKFFPAGFEDEKYFNWERGYKWKAHQNWDEELNRDEYRSLLVEGQYVEIAARAVRIEARTNLLFSFEKMAIRDAVKTLAGACLFATALYDFLHGPGGDGEKFDHWCAAVGKLPRRQTRVLTWPLVTVFGFIAEPTKHIFLKPTVTRVAAKEYGLPLMYQSTPSWSTYENFLGIAHTVFRDLRDMRPIDMIDVQSFLWVQGSDEYDD